MDQNKIILYQDDNEITRVAVRFADEDLWLTQNQLAEIYCTSRENITMHIKNIYADEELLSDSTSKDFLLVREEGSRQVKRNVAHYNLDMIIALGYRVQSQVAVRFRRWATQRLHEYIQKGFAMDDERLKQGGNRYFREGDYDFKEDITIVQEGKEVKFNVYLNSLNVAKASPSVHVGNGVYHVYKSISAEASFSPANSEAEVFFQTNVLGKVNYTSRTESSFKVKNCQYEYYSTIENPVTLEIRAVIRFKGETFYSDWRSYKMSSW